MMTGRGGSGSAGSKGSAAHPKRLEDLSDEDRLEPSAEDQQVFLENTEARGSRQKAKDGKSRHIH